MEKPSMEARGSVIVPPLCYPKSMPVTEVHQRLLRINDMKQLTHNFYGLRDQHRYLFSLSYKAQ